MFSFILVLILVLSLSFAYENFMRVIKIYIHKFSAALHEKHTIRLSRRSKIYFCSFSCSTFFASFVVERNVRAMSANGNWLFVLDKVELQLKWTSTRTRDDNFQSRQECEWMTRNKAFPLTDASPFWNIKQSNFNESIKWFQLKMMNFGARIFRIEKSLCFVIKIKSNWTQKSENLICWREMREKEKVVSPFRAFLFSHFSWKTIFFQQKWKLFQ